MKSSHSSTLISIIVILTVLALAGCSDDASLVAPAETPVIDTAPPAVPTGVAAAASGVNVKLSWDPNVVDEDFAGFMVYRVVWGTEYPMLDLPISDTSWFDTHPVDVACTYAVTALDEKGNESAWASVNFQAEPDRPRLRLE